MCVSSPEGGLTERGQSGVGITHEHKEALSSFAFSASPSKRGGGGGGSQSAALVLHSAAEWKSRCNNVFPMLIMATTLNNHLLTFK